MNRSHLPAPMERLRAARGRDWSRCLQLWSLMPNWLRPVANAARSLAINTWLSSAAHAGTLAEVTGHGVVDKLWQEYSRSFSIFVGCVTAGALVAWVRERSRIAAEADDRIARLDAIEAEQLSIRTLGDPSEQQVGQALLGWCRDLDPAATLSTGVIMFYPEASADQISRFEIDCLLIASCGIFVVEVKNWKHPISVTSTGWIVHKPEGTMEAKSPLVQNLPKVKAIHNALRDRNDLCPIPVYNLAILSHAQASLPMHAPVEAMCLGEARLFLRQAYQRAREQGMPSVPVVQQVGAKIAAITDQRPDAKHDFLLELHKKKGQALDYARLEREKQALIAQPAAKPRPVWQCAWTYVPSACFFVALAWWPSGPREGPAASESAMLRSSSASVLHSSAKSDLLHRKNRPRTRPVQKSQ